jgi:hypothetical protein
MFDKILFFLCISLGVSYMWSFSAIFAPIRRFLLKIPYVNVPLLCPECSAFWIGFIISFLYNPVFLTISIHFVSNVICGIITYFFASVLYKKLFL